MPLHDDQDPTLLFAQTMQRMGDALDRIDTRLHLLVTSLARTLRLAAVIGGLVISLALVLLGTVAYHTLALRQESQALLQGLTTVLRRGP